jgi:hypothetical protein
MCEILENTAGVMNNGITWDKKETVWINDLLASKTR